MKTWRPIFTIWVILWAFFLIRGFVKGEFREFKVLCRSNMEEKRSYILGEELNTFLNLCKKEIPEDSTYSITGDLDEHNRFRLIYYLYPRLPSDHPNYVLKICPNDSQYILKRIN